VSTQADSVGWELSNDGGGSWETVSSDGSWHDFSSPGGDLRWRSNHVYRGDGVNPACANLQIEWLYRFGVLTTIEDIPDDQGKQVRVTWNRSGYDIPESPILITQYEVYRLIEVAPDSHSSGQQRESVPLLGPATAPFEPGYTTYPPGDWDFITTVPAHCEETYSVVAPTLLDSTISQGMRHTVFFVRASTATPSVYFDCYPDSGYSLDNLAPAAPLNLEMASPTDLAWEESEAEDFDYFTVYGSATPELVETAAFIGYTIGITMDVTGDQYDYYHVTATDFSGNEGDASSVENTYAGILDVEQLPTVFSMSQNKPNPFDASTAIRFDVPKTSALSIKIFDAEGRLVKILTQGEVEPGRHAVVWVGDDHNGSPVSPGIYFAKMEAAGFAATRKVTLLR